LCYPRKGQQASASTGKLFPGQARKLFKDQVILEMDTGGRLYNIVLSKEILEAITLHALSNEKEEVAGLLLGSWVQERSKPLEFTGFVYKFCALPRVDRKKDRVEVCDEDLVKVQEAHQNSGVNVIGWFHSVSVWSLASIESVLVVGKLIDLITTASTYDILSISCRLKHTKEVPTT